MDSRNRTRGRHGGLGASPILPYAGQESTSKASAKWPGFALSG